MHGNRRYVKLAQIGLAAGLALIFLPSPAFGEIVAPTATRGFLAVAADGTPRVAFLSARDVVVARRTASAWSFRGSKLPRGDAVIAGLVVDRKGRATALVEAQNGSWLALGAPGHKARILARPRQGASFGPAGLALDAADRPAVAYAVRLKSGKTFLRLVTTGARGGLRTTGVTKAGFPASGLPPGAAPVLVRGRLHVVETYTSAAIDWEPQKKGGWIGQYLFASRDGSPTGRVGAASSGQSLWAAWTQLSADGISVLLTLSASTQETNIVIEHGIFVSLLLEAGRPEIGAYDWAQIDDWIAYAGVVADESGPVSEFDGRLDGYASTPAGGRQLLLSTASGLEWFEAPSRPSVSVSLSVDPEGRLAGRVHGAQGGAVQLYRELPSGRTLVATVPLEDDGSFAAADAPPTSPTLYRAVYVDSATGIPYASLLRTPVGADVGPSD
jgi:hypothetical protein